MSNRSTRPKMATNTWAAVSNKVDILQCIQEAKDSIMASIGGPTRGYTTLIELRMDRLLEHIEEQPMTEDNTRMFIVQGLDVDIPVPPKYVLSEFLDSNHLPMEQHLEQELSSRIHNVGGQYMVTVDLDMVNDIVYGVSPYALPMSPNITLAIDIERVLV